MEIEYIEQTSSIGSYQSQLVPERHSTALISTHDSISHGHIITFTDHRCIIEDTAGQYALRLPRTPASREWRTPLYTLQLLSDLRLEHPLPSIHHTLNTHNPPPAAHVSAFSHAAPSVESCVYTRKWATRLRISWFKQRPPGAIPK